MIRYKYGMDETMARAMVDSYNHEIDNADRCAEWSRNADNGFDRRVYGRLAQDYNEQAVEDLECLLHYGYDYTTIDDAGHIALKDEQMALAL